jgi:hypothetical protein
MERTRQQPKVIERLKNVFLEIPGTRLTATDAARLSGLDVADCLRFPRWMTGRAFVQFDHVGSTRQARFDVYSGGPDIRVSSALAEHGEGPCRPCAGWLESLREDVSTLACE